MNFEEKMWDYRRILQEQKSESKMGFSVETLYDSQRDYSNFVEAFSKLLGKLTGKDSIDDRIS